QLAAIASMRAEPPVKTAFQLASIQAFTFYGKRFVVMKREKNRITKLSIRPAEEDGAKQA
ncbi:hypothetical protein ACC754_44000, partial [Rhizobium johnstonii]